MKNVLAITLGTRDIQIKLSALQPEIWEFYTHDKKMEVRHAAKSDLAFTVYVPQGFTDTCCFSQPRLAGELLMKYYDEMIPVLHFPLLQPVIDFLKTKGRKIDYVFLLCTNQQGGYNDGIVKQKDYHNDTLYFGEIVSRYFQQSIQLSVSDIEIYSVTEEVTNMDYLYTHFEKESSNFFQIDPDEIQLIYLLPQGGIDHINQAFNLKLIQRFGEKVQQLQQAEGQEPRQLNFPRLFLDDLYRQRRLQHLNDFEFGLLAQQIAKGNRPLKPARLLALWCNYKLHQQVNQLPNAAEVLRHFVREEVFEWLRQQSEPTILNQLKALFVMVRIQYNQQNYNDMLWRMFTLIENLYKYLAEESMGWADTSNCYLPGNNERNEKWLSVLGAELAAEMDRNGIWLHNPNRKAYQYIFFRAKEASGIWDTKNAVLHAQVRDGLESVAVLRNKLAHEMKAVDKPTIENLLKSHHINLEMLLYNLGTVLQVEEYDFAHKTRDLIKAYLIN